MQGETVREVAGQAGHPEWTPKGREQPESGAGAAEPTPSQDESLGAGRGCGTGKEGPSSGPSTGGKELRPREKRTLLAMERCPEGDLVCRPSVLCVCASTRVSLLEWD